MIRQVTGVVLDSKVGSAIIDVAGFGIEVKTTSTLTKGETATLLTHMALRQDGIELYGFADPKDLSFFEMMLLVPGVGPKTALSFLSRAPRESLEAAIAKRDLSYLTRVAGLGKKAAEKLMVELSEKVSVGEEVNRGEDAEVFDTLVALGYTDREARKAVASIPMHIEGRDARLKAALSQGS